MSEDGLQAHYARDGERDRLASGLGRIEHLRTVEVVGRTLPPPPAVVADIGGGPGRYTDWLVGAGHTVVHRDLVAHHVDQVRARHGDGPGGPVDSAVGDARSLDLDTASVDVVLLLGPLYHLADPADRALALAEAARVVRPGGRVHAAAISRWSPRIQGILSARADRELPVVLDLIDGVERDGRMEPVVEGGFCGYCHRPGELRREVEEAGLGIESLVSLEGVASVLSREELAARFTDPTAEELLLDSLRAMEAVPELLGAGSHLLATARRPG